MKNRIRSGLLVAIVALVLTVPSLVQAAYIPYGVQNDVSYDTVVNTWGWTAVYVGDYGAQVSNISTIFGDAEAGDYIMLAAKLKGSSTFDVLAAATLADVTQYTSKNQTHAANGVEWYYNGGSMGFAGLGDAIDQNSADVVGSGDFGYSTVERDRLSWHTDSSYYAPPTTLTGGWRAGSNIWLNTSTDWERYVLTIPASSTPIPGAVWLLGSGLVGLLGLRRKANA